jgi:hypothetical protein
MHSILKTALVALVVASLGATAVGDGYDPHQKLSYANDPTRQASAPARAMSEAPRPPSAAGAAVASQPSVSFKVGDMVLVGKSKCELKLGETVVGNVSRGTRVTVLAVQGNWIGAKVDQNGKQLSGWITDGDLVSSNALAGDPQSPDKSKTGR